MTASFIPTHDADAIDVINFDAIAASEVETDSLGRRRYLIGGGGYFARSIAGWLFSCYGTVTTVSVPSTIAALEARDAREIGVAA